MSDLKQPDEQPKALDQQVEPADTAPAEPAAVAAEKPGKKKKKEKKKRTVGQEILSWVGTLLAAVIIASAIRALLIEPVRVQGGSMNNTLIDGEVMLVTKPAVLMGRMNRGDVVICRFPGRNTTKSMRLGAPVDVSLTTHTLFVKRLVALPGDYVEVRGGQLYVNDQPLAEPYVDYPARSDYPRTLLGDNEYMVMGDNRAGSHDSRSMDVGPISRDMIVGHPKLVILPLNKIRTIQ